MDELSRRIVDTAINLAEQGGFQAVRLRDVAAQANVALGTLYRRFASKEDILVAALEAEALELEARLRQWPAQGETPLERLSSFFMLITHGLCRRPNFARAVLRAVASGEPELTGKVTVFHSQVSGLIFAALRGPSSDANAAEIEPTEAEATVAFILQQIWFASLVGWMGGLHDKATVIEQVRTAAEILLRGIKEQS